MDFLKNIYIYYNIWKKINLKYERIIKTKYKKIAKQIKYKFVILNIISKTKILKIVEKA